MKLVCPRRKKENLKAIYSSDLQRTRKSAQCIANKHGLEPITLPELRELSFGSWEGMSFTEVEATYPGEMKQRMQNIATFQLTHPVPTVGRKKWMRIKKPRPESLCPRR